MSPLESERAGACTDLWWIWWWVISQVKVFTCYLVCWNTCCEDLKWYERIPTILRSPWWEGLEEKSQGEALGLLHGDRCPPAPRPCPHGIQTLDVEVNKLPDDSSLQPVKSTPANWFCPARVPGIGEHSQPYWPCHWNSWHPKFVHITTKSLPPQILEYLTKQ